MQPDYPNLYGTAIVDAKHIPQIDGIIAKITASKDRYLTVSNKFSGMPFWFVAVIHSMECSLSFKHHLHNGDPLTDWTIHVPKGRPKTGQPPFLWEDSAIDAMRYEGFDTIVDWSIPGILKRMELYNGGGYMKRNINTPYLWSSTNHYGESPNIGKFVSDGKFDPEAISQQIGAAAIIKRMDENGLL
jgi:lysozyme family protein